MCRVWELRFRDATVVSCEVDRFHSILVDLISVLLTSENMQVGYCPPLSNSWIIVIIWLYIALNRTPNMDCYWEGSTQHVGFTQSCPSQIQPGWLKQMKSEKRKPNIDTIYIYIYIYIYFFFLTLLWGPPKRYP